MTPHIYHLIFVGFVFLMMLTIVVVIFQKAGIKSLWLQFAIIVFGPVLFKLVWGLFR
jgi:hypothetical protein